MNPQVRFGEDLMSRVSYAMMDPQGAARMHRAIIAAINELARLAVNRAGVALDDVLDAVLVGNPVMHHLFLGIDPVELGGAPFAPAVASALDLKARDLGLKLGPTARVHVLPCIAGHVGADSLAVQLAEAPHLQDERMLVVDVGTNAEIVLGKRDQVYCASSPTGPAFEGAQITHGQRAAPGAIERVRIDPITLEPRCRVIGSEEWLETNLADEQANNQTLRVSADRPDEETDNQTLRVLADIDGETEEHTLRVSPKPTGICGSGIIEAVAEMFLAGILDADGRFDESAPARSARVRFPARSGEYVLVPASATATGSDIVVTQSDVRAIQLGKAALYAGVKLLMAHAGYDGLDRVVLAGAFGSYISPFHAMVLGLIPDCELDRVTAVGNAAGDGARIALLNRDQRREAARLAHWVKHVQTAVAPGFQDEFVAALALPHKLDAFPHLAGRLPARAPAESTRRSQRRRIALPSRP